MACMTHHSRGLLDVVVQGGQLILLASRIDLVRIFNGKWLKATVFASPLCTKPLWLVRAIVQVGVMACVDLLVCY